MAATNYSDVMDQLLAFGLIIPASDGLRIGTPSPVRVHTQDSPREKRGWYWLKEWSPSADRLLIVGSYGVFRGAENQKQRVALPKDDASRITPEQRAAMKRAWREQAEAAQRLRDKDAAKAADRARRIWTRLNIEGDSPYLASKGVIGYGLKYTEHGTAVLPLVDTGGKIHGLQFLRTASQAKEAKRPAKELWPSGMVMKGHFHLLGHDPHWIVLIAEGYATAASLHAATGYPVAVAISANNLQPVAEALRKRYKRAKILICADDDCWTEGNPGVTCASTAAMAVNGEWLRPVFGDETARQALHQANGHKLTDFNDLQTTDGAAAVREQVAARLSELQWGPPLLRAVSSSTEGAGKLQPLQYLDDLLPRFATLYGGKEGVFDSRDHILVTETDVRNLCCRPETFKAWKEHPERHIHRLDEVGFDPGGTDPAVTCNLWAGWPTEPREGKCDLLLETLRHMCSGERNSRELFDWVMKWLAYPIQHPGAKMKSTVVVHGPQGTGKNLFFETVMAIYGRYGSILDQSALQDKHNDCFSRKLFLIADEVIAQKERYDIKNMLKTLITGSRLRINPKHVSAYEEANHCNLVFLSNESMPVVLEQDDRRHCVMYTPPKKPEQFYAELLDEINNGGIAALHHHLLHLPLGNFTAGTWPPDTAAKRELIDLAQDSPAAFVDAVMIGDIPAVLTTADPNDTREEFPCPGLTQDWYDAYRHWCIQVGTKPASLKRFVNVLDKQCGHRAVRKRYMVDGGVGLDTIAGPHSILLFVLRCPEGEDETRWLGRHVSHLKDRLKPASGVSR